MYYVPQFLKIYILRTKIVKEVYLFRTWVFENVRARRFVIAVNPDSHAFVSEVDQGVAGSSLNLGLLAQIFNG